jgi:EAL domain-containing protein (putative c-di-GMP-specific phosphodiesterase class I)
MSLADETPVGVELLARSTVSDFEMPEDFFRLCSQLRVLSAVDRQCLMKCVTVSGGLPASIRRHVNLFPATLVGTPIGSLLSVFPEERPPGGYCVELAGRRMAENSFRLGEAVRALKQGGILVAVDDVGFGAQGLRQLVVFAPDLVKVDRSCVTGVSRDPQKEKSLRHLVRVAHDLGAQVVIEGIEERDDLDAVKSFGVRFGQGYLWGRPADLPEPLPSADP